MEQAISLWQVISRGLRLRCPQCGEGALFRSFLKQVEQCPACGERYGHIRADDGPAWFTILVVGHIVGSLMLAYAPKSTWPDWVHMIIWPVLTVLLIAVILPRSKGMFIGIIWRMKCAGSEA